MNSIDEPITLMRIQQRTKLRFDPLGTHNNCTNDKHMGLAANPPTRPENRQEKSSFET